MNVNILSRSISRHDSETDDVHVVMYEIAIKGTYSIERCLVPGSANEGSVIEYIKGMYTEL